MSFTVAWMPLALDELAAIWTAAADQNAVTGASHRIDQRLAIDPLNEGESRDGTERIAFEPPLRILIRVYAAERTVEVFSVGSYSRRS